MKNFTGIDSAYEQPENPEIRLDTTALSADEAADAVITALQEKGIIGIGDWSI
ncbi:adenylyl-sulfate kinase [Oceanimonas baumannii]|uniref:adenylyl-sulfate kinase n=1 Tax=Oceanimonas baumannii TaxID=129578 RepID=UPI001D1821C4|nr:adenylyl-sulfate kinase [Oceanimonas baumannii]MCC4266221.1 adenylyl-sulfate kinase [Oceanimonas baumannii]